MEGLIGEFLHLFALHIAFYIFLLLHSTNNQNKTWLVCGSLTDNFLGHTLVFCYPHIRTTRTQRHTLHTHMHTNMRTHLHMCSTFQFWSFVELKNKSFIKVKIGHNNALALLAWKGSCCAHSTHCVNMSMRNTLKRLVREECIHADLKAAW